MIIIIIIITTTIIIVIIIIISIIIIIVVVVIIITTTTTFPRLPTPPGRGLGSDTESLTQTGQYKLLFCLYKLLFCLYKHRRPQNARVLHR